MDLGPIIIVVVLVIVIPVAVLVTGGVVSALLGTFAKDDVEDAWEDTEWVELGG